MDRLKDLSKRLFRKRESFHGRYKEPELQPSEDSASRSWVGVENQEHDEAFYASKRKKTAKLFFWVITSTAVIILVIAGVFFVFIAGVGTVSEKDIQLTISTPTEIVAGEKVAFDVYFRNDNSIALESVEIIFDYPEDARPLFGEAPKQRNLRERQRAI
jgi:hypothetical protein